MTVDSLDLEVIEKTLEETLKSSGFWAVEEYTDFESRKTEDCLAVWSVNGIGLEEAGRCVSIGTAVVRAEIGFKILLMGRCGRFDDRAEFNDRCFEVCSQLACERKLGRVSLELGECRADMHQKRLVRELRAVFKVYMKEEADGGD